MGFHLSVKFRGHRHPALQHSGGVVAVVIVVFIIGGPSAFVFNRYRPCLLTNRKGRNFYQVTKFS